MRLKVNHFNLKTTIESGQFFQFLHFGDGYVVWSGDDLFYIEQRGNSLFYKGISKTRLEQLFGLSVPYEIILNSISKDPGIRGCIQTLPGLRIMHQEVYECIIAFVCSANSNIPKITKNMHLLSELFGEPVRMMGRLFHKFPKPGTLLPLEGVRAAKTGFRASYITAISRLVNAEWIAQLKQQEYGAAREMLVQLPGVGPKVADCVCLFALGHPQAFPVDVWIRRAMHELYFKSRRVSDTEIQAFAMGHFGHFCGYANQFLFNCRRTLRKELNQ